MSATEARRALLSPGRRQFLRQSGATLLAAAPMAAWAHPSECRSLAFVNTHTGETLSCKYFAAGRYDRATLGRVNHFLRDFRTGDVHPIDPGVLDILFELRARAERDDPYHVISGYRSPRTNAFLRRHSRGVSAHSLHMEGRAIDVRLPGFPTRKLRVIALGMRRGGVGYYPASDFVHLDTGRVRFW
ncbi:MAG: YcbK family protein [Steroidobacteraceae bacterium]